jgi:hypothetical protein
VLRLGELGHSLVFSVIHHERPRFSSALRSVASVAIWIVFGSLVSLGDKIRQTKELRPDSVVLVFARCAASAWAMIGQIASGAQG